MASAEEYAQWIVEHADQKGTPAFDVVAKAYQEAKQATPEAKPMARENAADEPSTLAFVGGNLNKGIAGLAGMPVDFATNVMNLGIAGYGVAKGALSGEPPELIKPGIGSSQWFEEMGRKAGLITKDAEPETTGAKYVAAALQAVPSAMLGRPTVAQLPRAATTAITSGIGAQLGADVAPEGHAAEGAIIGSMLPGGRSMAKAPSAGERATEAERARLFAEAKKLGIPIAPRLMKPDPSQQKIQNTVTAELKLPEGTPLTPGVLQNYRAAQYDAGWRPVINEPALNGRIVPNATFDQALTAIAQDEARLRAEFPQSTRDVGVQAIVDDLRNPQRLPGNAFTVEGTMALIKRMREAATRNLSSSSATDDTMRLGFYQRKVAGALENLLEDNIAAIGKPELLNNFRDSRKAMAQAHTVEAALDPVTGKVNPKKLAALQSDKGTLTGGLKQVAEVTAGFPGAVKEPTNDLIMTQRMSPWTLTHPPSVAAHLLTHMLDPITMSRPYQALLVNPQSKLTPAQERVVRLLIGTNVKQQGEE